MSNATRGGLIGQFAFMDLHGLPTDWLTTFVERLYAVTPEQVSNAAREHLDTKQMSVVVVGDMAKVRKQLDAVERVAAHRRQSVDAPHYRISNQSKSKPCPNAK